MDMFHIYIGSALGLGAAAYVFFMAHKLSGVVLLAAFGLVLQSILVTANWSFGAEFQSCQMVSAHYRECLPFMYKLSSYSGHVGGWLIPVGIVLLARSLNKSLNLTPQSGAN